MVALLVLVLAALAVPVPELEQWADEQASPDLPEWAASYRTSAQLFGELSDAVAASPYPIQVETIGESIGRRPIHAFHVSHPAAPPERQVLVFAGIHALEWISTEVAVDTLRWLLDHPVPGVGVTVIPLLNPDGRAKVEKDLGEGSNHYRRGNYKNVDLNRDFAVNRQARGPWKRVIPGYYRTSSQPLSQPETRALDALAGRERYERAASLHAFGGFLYYPWAGRFFRPPDHAEFVQLGRSMERAQGGAAYKTRQLGRWGFFFRAQGSEIDHLYALYGTRAFLVELTRSGIRPWKPKTIKRYFSWYNPANPERHRQRGLRAMQALVRHPPLPGEGQGPPALSEHIDIDHPDLGTPTEPMPTEP